MAAAYAPEVGDAASRASTAGHRAPRLRLVLCERRAAAPSRAARQARRRRRQRAARGGHHRQLRGAALRRALGHVGGPRAPAVPARDLRDARLQRLPREVARGVGDRARAPGLPAAEHVGRRGLRRRHGDRQAAARPARAGGRGPRAHGDHHLGRRRARRAWWPRRPATPRSRRASWCSRASRPASASRASRRGCCRASGRAPQERLAELGLNTVGDLQAADTDELVARFGERMGRWLKQCAFFHDTSPVQARAAAKSLSSETTFDEDVEDLAALEETIRRLAADVCGGLQRRNMRGRTIGIKVRLDDWTNATRARTIEAWTNDQDAITDDRARAAARVRAGAAGAPARRARGVLRGRGRRAPVGAGGSARAGGVRRAVAVAGGRLRRLVAVRRRVDLRVRLGQRLVALRASATRLWSLSRSSSGSYSVWSRRLRATTTPVAAVTPATPARPTIFQGTFMGA